MAGLKVSARVSSKAITHLAQKLGQIDRKAARKALRAAVNEASKDVLATAKSLVPVRTGTLRKSLGRKVYTRRGGAVAIAVIGPRKGYRVVVNGRPVNPVNYAHLVEFGRREVVAGTAKGKPTGKKFLANKGAGQFFGKRVRSVPPRPFLRPAWEQHKARVVKLVIARMKEALAALFAGGATRKR